ncbi:MAG: cache domain-containing protein, partial [Thermodesulfobacteriota bacterium]
MNPKKRLGSFQWALVLLFGLIALALAAGGYWFNRYEAQVIRGIKYTELRTIARLKADQIAAWRRERLADARLYSMVPFLHSIITQWLESPDDIALKADILERLKLLRDTEGYENIFLADPDGRLLISVAPGLTYFEAHTKDLIAQAVSSREAVFGDVFRCETHHVIHLDLAAPVLGEADRPLAVLVLRSDPEQYLFPLIQSWPTPSRSAETLLIRKDGDGILFLNRLRHRPDPPLTLRIPLSQADLPAARAALGETGEVEGR